MAPSTRPATSQASKPPRVRERRAAQSKAALSPRPPSPDVIVLSSDDDDVPLRRPLPKRQRAANAVVPQPSTVKEKGTNCARGRTLLDDIQERQSGSSDVARLRLEIEALKKERDRFRSRCAKAEVAVKTVEVEKDKAVAKASDLEKSLKRKATSQRPDYSELEDTVSCEICTLKMWSPATLVGCGHSFCEKCLHDWFNTAFTQHVQLHPDFLAGPQIPEDLARHSNNPRVAPVIEQIRADFRKRVPSPEYTCPTCRVAVKRKPVEVYALKEFVRKAAKLSGESEEGPRRANRAVGSVFDGFFPKK
ncbi:hypothetical protein DFH11DRAFT_304147 [Phellopilus nigrolimitatus]|nr:hypothetical protein DFH11DRAFT_304147 [Phellopilus nigrolimitatus]